MFDIKTDRGMVHFSKRTVRQICISAVDSCEGKAVIYNFKGKGRNKGEAVFQPRNEKAVAADIEIEGDGDELMITLYVVIRFGASIKGTAEKIINSIFHQLNEAFDVTPQKVVVINTGTASKDVIARRMEFIRTAGSKEVIMI